MTKTLPYIKPSPNYTPRLAHFAKRMVGLSKRLKPVETDVLGPPADCHVIYSAHPYAKRFHLHVAACEALRERDRAKRVNDTRRLHKAQEALEKARHAQLRG